MPGQANCSFASSGFPGGLRRAEALKPRDHLPAGRVGWEFDHLPLNQIARRLRALQSAIRNRICPAPSIRGLVQIPLGRLRVFLGFAAQSLGKSASVTHSGLIARVPISPGRNYILIEKRKPVSPWLLSPEPNAPQVI